MVLRRFITSFFVLSWSITSKCQTNFFLAENIQGNVHYDYSCVTNSSFALSWIDDIIHDSPREVAGYIPVSPRSEFDCSIEDDYVTKSFFVKDPWSLRNSTNEIILDRRWEDMKVIKTTYSSGINNIYEIISSDLEGDFEIPLSIRTDLEAHIFLCDGAHPSQSNCYWFMLQAFSGKESVIRKCARGLIPLRRNSYPTQPCRIKLVTVDHSDFPRYLSKQYWSHFKLKKKSNHLSFAEFDEKKYVSILELTDNGNVINVTHMFVHSKNVNALWKIHHLTFLYTNEETVAINLGSAFDSIDGNICISMFISMCPTCRLKLTIMQGSKIIGDKIYETETSKWSEIKFLLENIKRSRFYLHVSTIGTSSERFWAIDNLRLCRKNEFRRLLLTGFGQAEASCQLMHGKKNVISSKGKSYTTIENNCPENTIGEFCVPCKWIYDNCVGVTICSKQKSAESRCVCSSGSQISNNCLSNCNPGFYGHGCQKKCGKCFNNRCDPVDGTCFRCNDGYKGPKCDIPPTVIFKNAPKVVKVDYEEATVQMTNFEVQGSVIHETSLVYSIQYKINNKQEWKSIATLYKLHETKPVTIKNLEADATYVVRCVLMVTSTNITYSDGVIPFSTFTTKCQEIDDNNIYIQSSNTSINISLNGTNNLTCKLDKYVATISSGDYPVLSRNNHIIFDTLTPFTTYTITIQRNSTIYQKTFRTSEGVPEPVQNLTVSKVTSSGLQLSWQKPVLVFGKLQYYVMEYQHLASAACLSRSFKPKNKTVWRVNSTSATVSGLVPFSVYSFSVFAVNTKFSGRPLTTEIVTRHLDEIQENEIPTVIHLAVESKNAMLKLSQIDCTKMRGATAARMTLICVEEWCTHHTTTDYDLRNSTLVLTPLHPYSHYALKLQFCREGICSKMIKNLKFQTKPSVPSMVEDLLVYSKSKNTVSLRWRPPYPPTGILANYQVEYYFVNFFILVKRDQPIIVKNGTCKLWPKFHCLTLTGLLENKKYNITVSARNENPVGFGLLRTTVAVTRTEPSEAPYDLNIFWSKTNDLVLNWKHPNQSNGDIQFFTISLIPESQRASRIEKQIIVNEETYSFIYDYKIDFKELSPSTGYTITISAYNGHFGKELRKSDTSPPDIPLLNEEPQISSLNNSITLQISPKQPEGVYNYTLLVIISDPNNISVKFPELDNFEAKNARIVRRCNITNFNEVDFISIGNDSQPENCDQLIENPRLNPGAPYNITLILTNTFGNKSKYKKFSFTIYTKGDPIKPQPKDSNLLGLISLVLLIPIAVIVCVLRHKLRKLFSSKKTSEIPMTVSTSNSRSTKKAEEDTTRTSEVFSKTVRFIDFETYVKECERSGEFDRQHSMIFNYPASSIYESPDGGFFLDYIDMEFIDGTKIPKAYIAADIPKASFTDDFWKIVWEENVDHIVLICHPDTGKMRKYWPKTNEKLKCHDITVQLAYAKNFDDYNYRKFILVRHEQIKQVDQIDYPYCGLNPQKFIPLCSKILKYPLKSSSPILVHSNSFTETGLVLLCDMSLRMAKEERVIDVLKNLKRLNNDSTNLVDNVEYYKLAHYIILEYIFGSDCDPQSNDYVNF